MMGETTTTTTKAETTTTTTEAPETTTTTTEASTKTRDNARENVNDQDSGLPEGKVGAGADAGNVPNREEMLESAGTASPHAPNAGLKDGTKVLGEEEKSTSDAQDEAKREALSNAKGEQDLSA